MRFIKIEGKRSLIDLDEINIINSMEERDLYAINFYLKYGGSYKILFTEKSRRDEIFFALEKMLKVHTVT